MSRGDLSIAVVGCGAQGRNHLAAYQQIEGVRISAICDLDTTRLEIVGNQFEVDKRFTSFEDLLEAERYDLVSVCTMPVSHREIVLSSLSRGANVLCEKPTAMNLAEAYEMSAAARRAGRLLTVGFNMRFLPNAQFLRKFVAEGGIGEPIYTRAWTKATDIPWWGKHYVKRISGGGVLASTAVHILDCALWVAGNPVPTSATASMTRIFPRKRNETTPNDHAATDFDVEDTITGHIRFSNGSWMTLEGGWAWDRPDYSYSFEMVGDRAAVQLDPLQIVMEEQNLPIDVTGRIAGSFVGESNWEQSIAREIADVVTAVRTQGAPTVSFDQAIVVQAIVDALYKSAAIGAEVPVVLGQEDSDLSA